VLTFMHDYSVACSCAESVISLSSGLRNQFNIAVVILGKVEMHFALPCLIVAVLAGHFGILLTWVFTEESRSNDKCLNNC